MFVGLHRHSHYSKRDGIAKVPDMVNRIGSLGQKAWALTDHGTTSGLMEAYKETQRYNKEHGTEIKFIFGCEMYWVPNIYVKDRKASCHLLVLATNETGYHNLLKLTTLGYGDKGKCPDNYFYTMRVTNEMLKECKEGLIVTSACMGGILNPQKCVVNEENNEAGMNTYVWDKELAYGRAEQFREIFGNCFYLEVQTGTTSEQMEYNGNILDMSEKLNIPVIVTEDSHYVRQEDADLHRAWLGISLIPDKIDPEEEYQEYMKNADCQQNRFAYMPKEEAKEQIVKEWKEAKEKAYYQTDDYYIHSEDEVRRDLDYMPKEVVGVLIENTNKLANRCETVHIEFGGKHFPSLDLDEPPLDAVCKIVAQGWKEKIVGRVPESEWPKYKAQISHELKILEKCDYLTYFLMNNDFLSWARSQHIRMGIGRGSIGGSLIAYLMDITRIDPIKYGLVFERFAHDKRVSLPDVDSDVQNTRRQELIEYLVKKYVEVYHVRTFGTMAEKGAMQRAADALHYTADQKRALSKLDGIDSVSDEKLQDLARKYVGIIQSYGTHASAIMLFPSDPTQWCAIEKQGELYVCAYEYPDLEAQGLLKLDILGIKTLDAIDECMNLVEDVDLDNLPDSDETTFNMLNKLDVLGCFQIESGGMMNIIKEIHPKSIFDLVPLVALYRPSTIQSGMVQEFTDRRKGKQFEYLHSKLESVLKDTYGVLLYQEQAMKIVQVMAGYDLGKADMFRRAIGHKVPEEMAVLISQFEKDGSEQGVDKDTMKKLAEWLTNCAAYQFNKSHSAAYGYTCYQTAYLKAHYPAEYLCSYLNAYKDSKQEDLLPYVEDIQKHGIKLLPPDGRKSLYWTVEDYNGSVAVRMGISFIRSVGKVPLPITEESLFKINKAKAENLIKAGAVDYIGDRGTLLKRLYASGELSKLNKNLSTATKRLSDWNTKLASAKEGTKKRAECLNKIEKYTQDVATAKEKIAIVESTLDGKEFDRQSAEIEVLGMTFEDPFKDIDVSQFQEPDMTKGSKVLRVVVGIVTKTKRWMQKNNKPMMFFTIKCPSGRTYDLVMFNYCLTDLKVNKVYKFSVQGDKFRRLL